ncbi:hypothetical protein HK405_007244 [Cladochytrium tenue]|nr:hypothetical protein HK405_007244 [Cladochytrium tenue]
MATTASVVPSHSRQSRCTARGSLTAAVVAATAIAAACAPLAAAAPSPFPAAGSASTASGSGHAFQVPMVVTEKPHASLMAGITAMRLAGASMISLNETSAAASSGSDLPSTVTPVATTEYRAQISIGTPAQTFNMLFDTGSYDLWVVSSSCTNTICMATTNVYNSAASSTYANPNIASAGDTYADGTTIDGSIALDTVTVGSYSVANFSFTDVTSYSTSSTTADFDGIIGMSLNITSAQYVNEPLINVMAGRGVLPTAQFGYYIASDETTGVLTFGGYDTSYFADSAASLSWFPVDTSDVVSQMGYWGLPIQSITVGSATTTVSSTNGVPPIVIMDTGTSLGLIPSAALDGFASISGAQKEFLTNSLYDYVYSVPCGLKNTLTSPVLTLNIGNGGTLTLSPFDYIIQIDSSPQTCIVGFQTTESTSLSSNIVIMGNTFLKRYYTVFDYTNRKVGFTVAKGRTGTGGTAGTSTAPPTACGGRETVFLATFSAIGALWLIYFVF